MTRRKPSYFWGLLIGFGLLGCTQPTNVSAQQQAPVITGYVVVDGDTIRLFVDRDDDIRLRLAGIDAPEADQPYGALAESYLAGLLQGQAFEYEVLSRDIYGREIVNIYIADLWVNLWMVQNGHAWWYHQYSDDPDLEAAHFAAQDANIGLWAEPDPIAPWDWRAGRRSLVERLFHAIDEYVEHEPIPPTGRP